MIHPTAVVHPEAVIGEGTEVGPYVVIDQHVRIGQGCRIGPHVYFTGHTTIGNNNAFHAGCVVGDAPQDLKYQGQPTRLEIGNDNIFREHVTIHRATDTEGATRIGDHNLLMAGAHVGHNSSVGNHVVIANCSMLGGHVTVQDHVFISATCLLHQFVTVGKLSMMQGKAGISLDLPPYCMAAGVNGINGLNVVGLRRAGLNAEERKELKSIYHQLLRSGVKKSEVIPQLQQSVQSEAAKCLVDFVSNSKRGVLPDRGGKGRD